MTAAFAAGMLLVAAGLSLGTLALVESVVGGGVDA